MSDKPVRYKRLRDRKGNSDAYWNDVNLRNKANEDGEITERAESNPDCLPWVDKDNRSLPSRQQEVLRDAESELQGRQRKVYKLYMKGDMSLEEIAGSLERIKKCTVQVYLDRAIAYVTRRSKALALERGIPFEIHEPKGEKTNEQR